MRSYPELEDKGPVIGGYRLTLLTSSRECGAGDPVRVIHICESMAPDRPLYVMGPKPVLGEYVDDEPATDPAPDTETPLAPASYDGRVAGGPGIDPNYDVTEYRFETPGRHTIQWRLGRFASNVLAIEVTP